MAEEYKKLVLKPHEENRLLKGEFWVYDNELRGNLRAYRAGEICRLHTSGDMYIATGYVNPASTIAFRVLSYEPEAVIDRAFLRRRHRNGRPPAPGHPPRQCLLPHGIRRGRFSARPGHRPLRRLFHRPDHHRRHGKLQGRHLCHCRRNASRRRPDREIAGRGTRKGGHPLCQSRRDRGPEPGKDHRNQRPEIQDRFPEKPEDRLFSRPARQLPAAGVHRRRQGGPGRVFLRRSLGIARPPLRRQTRRISRNFR